MSSIVYDIELPVLGQFLLGGLYTFILILVGIKILVQSLEWREVIKARTWAVAQFRSCFVFPEVKPLGRRGRFICSLGIRILSDLLGLVLCVVGAAMLFDTFGAAGQISLKLYLSLVGLAFFYVMLGFGMMVQGRKEQKRIRADDRHA